MRTKTKSFLFSAIIAVILFALVSYVASAEKGGLNWATNYKMTRVTDLSNPIIEPDPENGGFVVLPGLMYCCVFQFDYSCNLADANPNCP